MVLVASAFLVKSLGTVCGEIGGIANDAVLAVGEAARGTVYQSVYTHCCLVKRGVSVLRGSNVVERRFGCC